MTNNETEKTDNGMDSIAPIDFEPWLEEKIIDLSIILTVGTAFGSIGIISALFIKALIL